MSFLLPCPSCGPRDVYEFRWGGPRSRRPVPDAAPGIWVTYLYMRENPAGRLQEWWYHRMGCRRWFLAVRDTRTNAVAHTFWPPRAADPEPTEGPPAKPAEP